MYDYVYNLDENRKEVQYCKGSLIPLQSQYPQVIIILTLINMNSFFMNIVHAHTHTYTYI